MYNFTKLKGKVPVKKCGFKTIQPLEPIFFAFDAVSLLAKFYCLLKGEMHVKEPNVFTPVFVMQSMAPFSRSWSLPLSGHYYSGHITRVRNVLGRSNTFQANQPHSSLISQSAVHMLIHSSIHLIGKSTTFITHQLVSSTHAYSFLYTPYRQFVLNQNIHFFHKFQSNQPHSSFISQSTIHMLNFLPSLDLTPFFCSRKVTTLTDFQWTKAYFSVGLRHQIIKKP